MTALLAILTPIALINSLSTLPPGVAGIAASLGSRRPYLTAIAFIAGKFVPLFLFGLLLAVGLDTVFDNFKTTAKAAWQDPGFYLVLFQFLIGTAMLLLAYRLSRPGESAPDQEAAQLTPMGMFSVVAGATVVGLPGALFYFAAIDQILRAELNVVEIINSILFYNLVYLAPLILIVLVSWIFGPRAEPLFRALQRFFERWGKSMLSIGVLCLGAVLVADAVGWFTGFPILPISIR